MNNEPDERDYDNDSHYDEVEEQRRMRFNDYCAMRDFEQGIPDWMDDD